MLRGLALSAAMGFTLMRATSHISVDDRRLGEDRMILIQAEPGLAIRP